MTKYRIAIFVDSEFFHGKNYEELQSRLKHGKRPDYWLKKIDDNIRRDRLIEAELHGLGYIVLRFWGDEVIHDIDSCIKTIVEAVWESKIQGIDFDEQGN